MRAAQPQHTTGLRPINNTRFFVSKTRQGCCFLPTSCTWPVAPSSSCIRQKQPTLRCMST